MEKTHLNPNTILQAEFEYIATTATQSNEDRAKVTSFYFVTVGSLLAAIFGAQYIEEVNNASGNPRVVFWGFCLLFTILTILGYLTVAQLARLRTAWREFVHAMNVIKEYYIMELGGNLDQAFLWKTGTIPPAYKPGSVANFLVHEVTILSGLIFSAAVFFFLLGVGFENAIWVWAVSIILGILMWRGQYYLYKRSLDKHKLSLNRDES